MVLTNPEMVSGIVGLQPLVSIDTAEAGLLYQSFRRAGIDFNQDFSFLEFGKERDHLKTLVNDRAAENVLRTHQGILGITLPDRPLQKDEIISFTTQLLGGGDTRKANLAHGLLSGFPLEDCQHWVESGQLPLAIPALKKVDGVDARFGDQTITTKDGKQVTGKWDPIPNLNPDNYSMTGSRNHFLPDTRMSSQTGAPVGMIEGFGLRWSSPFPPRESTIKHCQKVLQIDREIGLIDFVKQQRNMFRPEDNIKAIGIAKQTLKPAGKSGVVGGAARALIGIFSVFEAVKNVIIPPEKPRQPTVS